MPTDATPARTTTRLFKTVNATTLCHTCTKPLLPAVNVFSLQVHVEYQFVL